MTTVNRTAVFVAERPRLVRIAGNVLGDPVEAEDVVQQAWLRLHRAEAVIDNLPGWLTTVTTRLCLDRLRARTPTPFAETERTEPDESLDPAEDVVLADTVGAALQVVLDRLTPTERVAFVLHDTFGIDFPTVAQILGRTPSAARKLASRARAKVAPSVPEVADSGRRADAAVVDAFMAAARQGDFAALMRLLAPDALVTADQAAIAAGTPSRIEGGRQVAEMFNGSAHAALPVTIGDHPGAAWFHRGRAQVAFDFTVVDGVVHSIEFRAAPEVLAAVHRRAATMGP